MALVWYDLVEELTSTGGTGAFTLAGATSGHRSFSVVGNGNTCYYMARGSTFTEWEVGLGTWSTGGTLARTTVLASSNSGSAVDFTGTGHTVRLVAPASFLASFGNTYQPLDADLTAIAALTTDAFGRALLTKTDAASVRTYIGAGTGDGDVTLTGAQTLKNKILADGESALSLNPHTRQLVANDGTTVILDWSDPSNPVAKQSDVADRLLGANNLGDVENYATALGNLGGVPTARTLTINGTTYDLAADHAWTISATDVGLGNVDNTSDANKPVSTAQQTAIDGRLEKSENLDDLPNKASARSNLGLGDLATVTPGTGVSSAIAINIGSVGSFIVNSGALGTPSSGTLTNCSGLPVSGITASTSTAIGVGSIELGHATDTTLSRLSAGDVAVEGNRIFRAGGTDVPVADGGTGASSFTAYAVVCAGTTGAGAMQNVSGVGTSGQVLTSNGASALPTWQDVSAGARNIWIPASALIPRVTNGPGVNSSEGGTNLANYDTLDFDASTQEYAHALVVMPSNYAGGTITARFFWTADSGTGDVIWSIAGRVLADDDAIDTARGTAQTVTDTLLSAADMHRTAATSACTIAGSPAANAAVLFEVARVAANVGDTLGVDARLLGVEVTF